MLDPDLDLKQTRFYQDVHAEGKQEGKLEGTLDGRRIEAASLLMRLAQVRFGDVPSAIQASIADAELEQLEHWLERLVTAPSLAAIFTDSAHKGSTREDSQAMPGITSNSHFG